MYLAGGRLLVMLLLSCSVSLAAEQSPVVGLSRLDCGTIRVNAGRLFSDTFSYAGQTLSLVESCYLIRHGDNYMLWDTGLSASLLDVGLNNTAPISMTLDQTLQQQLATAGFDSKRISYVGISHYHPDHTGQLQDFPTAKLLIGAKDWTLLISPKPPRLARADDFKHWISKAGTVMPVPRDLDVFGDGAVVILATPGHTPGHKSLLVRLNDKGNVLLTGDLAHFRENYIKQRVPLFNTDRADSLASLDRIQNIAATLNAHVIIQHDPEDVAKLAAFPNWSH